MDYLKNKVLLGCKRVEIMMEVKTRPMKELDRIDRNILNELQKDGRISNVELSKRVGLSPTPCLERVRRLERQGYITGYTAILNPQFLDASLLVFVEITLNRGAADVFEQFNKAVQELEEIQECHLVSGDFDYLLKTRVSDMSAYRRLLGETLLRLPGVNDTRTYVVMEEVKQSNRLVIKTR
jgi:Lrp/AsnC family leucine-responsive transcriptional regulator